MPPDGLAPVRLTGTTRSLFAAGALPVVWQAALLRLAAAAAVLLLVFWPDWQMMAGQWWNSSTYNHILLVPVIIGWLVSLRGAQVLKLEPECWWPGLVGLGGAVVLWTLGALAGFAQVSQAGTVAMIMAIVPLLLGVRVAAALLFPLFYMVFLVPAGDELIPLLQTITAKLTIALVHLSQVPATIDGVFIHTPAGLFEVAQACSGVKFLTAMIAFGALAANVCFVGWQRRVPFMAACVVVPVLANGVRAWGTVYVAQFKGAEFAGGMDHIIYGWVFFGVVIAGILGASWRFFNRAVDDPMFDADAIKASPLLARFSAMAVRPAMALAVAGGLVLTAQGWVSTADGLQAPLPAQIALPEVSGWQRVAYNPRIWWEPRATGADRRLLGRYADGQGRVVDVFVALYSSQGPGKKAGGFGEGAVRPDSSWSWQGAGEDMPDAHGDRLLAGGPTMRLAQTTYRTGSLATGSNLRLKLANIQDRLFLRARPTMLLIISAEDRPEASAAGAIAAWRASAGPLPAWMDHLAEVR